MAEEKVYGIKAIKKYFEKGPNGKKLTLEELKALSKEDRAELSRLAEVEVNSEPELPAYIGPPVA